MSALADNALLILTIALLVEQALPGWWAPMLKFGFTLAYVLLAPLVGPLADAMPKARLMAWMNGVKVLGAATLCLGLHPVLGFAIVGLGAAAYAPSRWTRPRICRRPWQWGWWSVPAWPGASCLCGQRIA